MHITHYTTKSTLPIISLWNDRGKGLPGPVLGPVKQFRLQLAKLLLEVWVLIGESFYDGRMPGPEWGLGLSSQVLVA